MSLQWTLVACFLYVEIAVVILLLLPFISAKLWQRFFKSRILQGLTRQANIYFFIFIGILILFFIDSIRAMMKYAEEKVAEESHGHVTAEMQISVKLFRSQRNFFISGFALFLWLVIRRLVTLITYQAILQSNYEAALKQAQSASAEARRLMRENEKQEKSEGTSIAPSELDDYKNIVKELEDEIHKTRKEADHYKLEVEALKSQAKNVTTEYDRLMEEHRKLQEKTKEASGDYKKDD